MHSLSRTLSIQHALHTWPDDLALLVAISTARREFAERVLVKAMRRFVQSRKKSYGIFWPRPQGWERTPQHLRRERGPWREERSDDPFESELSMDLFDIFVQLGSVHSSAGMYGS